MLTLRQLVLTGLLTLPPSLFPLPAVAQKRALTFEDFIALPSVGDAQLSPDGRRVRCPAVALVTIGVLPAAVEAASPRVIRRMEVGRASHNEH